jgi:hypothetical protein
MKEYSFSESTPKVTIACTIVTDCEYTDLSIAMAYAFSYFLRDVITRTNCKDEVPAGATKTDLPF